MPHVDEQSTDLCICSLYADALRFSLSAYIDISTLSLAMQRNKRIEYVGDAITVAMTVAITVAVAVAVALLLLLLLLSLLVLMLLLLVLAVVLAVVLTLVSPVVAMLVAVAIWQMSI
jgi:hypothetical protein